MKTNFNDCLNRLLKDEGGYSNDPSDSGGATNFGITIIDYKKYIKADGTPDDVRHMTVAQASVIYKTKYWDALSCDKLASGVDYTCFDYGVHSGLARPRKALQTFKSLTGTNLSDAICDERTAFLTNLANSRPKDQKFLKGWLARVARVKAYSRILGGKKDATTGPATGVTATLSIWATMSQYFHAHPYFIAAGAIAAGALVWYIVHTIRNRKTTNVNLAQ